MAYIYKITNNVNDKVYIGQTSRSIPDRWKAHKHMALKTECQFPLYRAIRKHGIEQFNIEVIEECDTERLNERETFWIAFFDAYKSGYNATLGGSGMKRIDEAKVKELWDEGFGIKKIARTLNTSANPVKWILRGYEPYLKTKDERYEKALRNKAYKSIAVKQYDANGMFLNLYPSLSEAERQTNTDASTIMRVCKYRSTYANGFQWRYADDDTPVGKVKIKFKKRNEVQNGKSLQQIM